MAIAKYLTLWSLPRTQRRRTTSIKKAEHNHEHRAMADALLGVLLFPKMKNRCFLRCVDSGDARAAVQTHYTPASAPPANRELTAQKKPAEERREWVSFKRTRGVGWGSGGNLERRGLIFCRQHRGNAIPCSATFVILCCPVFFFLFFHASLSLPISSRDHQQYQLQNKILDPFPSFSLPSSLFLMHLFCFCFLFFILSLPTTAAAAAGGIPAAMAAVSSTSAPVPGPLLVLKLK